MSNSSEEGLAVVTLKLIAKIFLGFFSSLYGAWVITVVWAWFAVAILGLPPITMAMAIAAMILRGVVFTSLHDLKVALALDKINSDIKKSGEWLDWIGYPVLYTVVLFSGTLWHYILFPLCFVLGFC